MEAVMYGVVSNGTDHRTPAGKPLASSPMRCSTARFTWSAFAPGRRKTRNSAVGLPSSRPTTSRSEEHTSELQSLAYLVCRLLLEKKKKRANEHTSKLELLSYLVCRLLV